MGAWIETILTPDIPCRFLVAPYVGAWIETVSARRWGRAWQSLPTWERGLKPYLRSYTSRVPMSLPTWERGLKPGAADRLRLR